MPESTHLITCSWGVNQAVWLLPLHYLHGWETADSAGWAS